ncbi:hypothetical protein GCM10023187_46700 [Nibrella viscosa]|uniref:YHYH domain-containing protein n=1 Tax=Nibrella viscosa TaxID=1084524 RepID=A0ABP8KT30_9BACT
MNRIPFFHVLSPLTLLLGLTFIIACRNSTDPVSPTTNTTAGTTATVGAGVPDVYRKLYGVSEIYLEGTNVVIKAKGLPDHKSPYYKGTSWESTLYVNDTRSGFSANPHRIAGQNYTFKIPLNPQEDAAHAETPLGPIGISLNGVPFFNQYAAGRAPLTMEIYGFDLYGGHPAPMNNYHYHVEPAYLTEKKGQEALLGFLLDGFPVYGPVENGKLVTNKDLDKYHGHMGKTADYPNGIYHYHVTAEDPYINGSGFYGKAGTLSQ